MEKTDKEIIELVRKDPEYFKYIVERYQEPIFRYLKRMSYFPSEDIEDMVQEVFIKTYRNINSYDSERASKFSSFIYRIAHNHLIDEIRKRGSRPVRTENDYSEMAEFIKSGVNIEKEFIGRECLEKVRDIILEMPIKYREVLVLRFLEEKSYEEIMEILRKPRGSVSTLINRGRGMLKEKIKEAGIECF